MTDSEWIQSLVGEYEQPLCRYARSLCGNDATARDAEQETFLRLCKAKPGKVRGREAAWLFRVCRTRVLDLRKKEKPMHILSETHAATLAADTAAPDEHSARRDAESRIPGMIQSLPERHQEAVRLKFQQNLSYRQIAEVLGISESNVGYILHHALKSLREQMTQLQEVRP